MFRTPENDTEILLGNKQLLGIFFVFVVLLGVFFTAGYLMGRGSGEKKVQAASADPSTAAAQPNNPASGETHSVPGDTADKNSDAVQAPETSPTPTPAEEQPVEPKPENVKNTPPPQEVKPQEAKVAEKPAEETRSERGGFVPQPGQTFLQVAATDRNSAEALAEVLTKKGFRAHAAPKPGDSLYRVLVGPMKDAGDLNQTREALMKGKGFREVIVRKY